MSSGSMVSPRITTGSLDLQELPTIGRVCRSARFLPKHVNEVPVLANHYVRNDEAPIIYNIGPVLTKQLFGTMVTCRLYLVIYCHLLAKQYIFVYHRGRCSCGSDQWKLRDQCLHQGSSHSPLNHHHIFAQNCKCCFLHRAM